MSDALLAVEAAQKSFGANQVLAGVQLTVRESEIVGLLGPNGSGKSTLLNVISGFSRADRGCIRFAGQDITGHAAHRIAASGLVRTFQLPAMPHRMTVREVVQAGRPAGHGVGPMLGRLAFDPEVDELLEQFLLAFVPFLKDALVLPSEFVAAMRLTIVGGGLLAFLLWRTGGLVPERIGGRRHV